MSQNQNETPVAVGIIGLGRSGWNIHARAIAELSNFRVVAVADPEKERQNEAISRFGCAAYATPQELLRDASVELVVVATPSHTHAPLAIQALDAGKHVLVEKPMATSIAEADAMIAAARNNEKTLAVYQARRVASDFLKVRDIIASGVLGPIHFIKLSAYSYTRRRDWQTLQKYGGGLLNNMGAHYVDQVLSLAGGQWNDLFVDLRHLVSAGDADDHVKIVFRGQKHIVADIEISSAAATPASPPHWTVMGRYGALTGSLTHLDWKYYDPSQVEERQVLEGTQARAYEVPENLPWITQSVDLPQNDLCHDFYQQFYATLRTNAPSPAPPEEIRQLTALFDQCRAQMR